MNIQGLQETIYLLKKHVSRKNDPNKLSESRI